MSSRILLITSLAVLLLGGVAWLAARTASRGALPEVRWVEADEIPLADDEVPPRRAPVTAPPAPHPVIAPAAAAPPPRPAVRVTGRVVDASGRPLADARVVLELRERGGARRRHRVAAPAVTGATGRFAFSGEGYPRLSLSLIVEHARHALAVFDRNADGRTPLDTGDLVLRDGVQLSGSVTDPNGVPIAGARLLLRPEPGERLRWVRDLEDLLPALTSDERGGFATGRAPPGRFRIEATARGRARGVTAPFTLADGDELRLAPIVLAEGRRLTGVVVDRTDAPIDGAEITVTAGPAGDGGVRRARSDSAGHFAFDHLPAGSVRVRVSAPGHLTHETGALDPRWPARITLDPGLRVTGLVRGPGAAEVTVFSVRARRLGSLAGGRVGRAPRRRAPVEPRVHHPGGRFAIPGLDEGRYVIEVDAEDHPPATSEPLELGRDRPAPDVVVVLAAGLILRGTVQAAGGDDPIPGARVELVVVREGGAPRTVGTTVTGSDGGFAFERIPPGRYRLAARAPGFAETVIPAIDLPGVADGLTLTLARPATLTGRVAGIPAGLDDPILVVASSDRGRRHRVVARPDGSYRLENLPPGAYRVRAQPANPGEPGHGSPATHRPDVVLTAGQVVTFDPVLAMPSRRRH